MEAIAALNHHQYSFYVIHVSHAGMKGFLVMDDIQDLQE